MTGAAVLSNSSGRDEAKLPKWARDRLQGVRDEVDRLRSLESAHAVLDAREWFTLAGPHDASDAPRTLWLLDKNSPFPVCSLAHGDALLVGRAKAAGPTELKSEVGK
ncbi:hypothetical protein GOB57_24085 [Sinorhizobium meliloti]|nr:hypothetical protein [Sinorhizobium meliloti]